jgi:hypothetical protein
MTHRFICEILEEMRTAIKVGRIDMLKGLIEEVQTSVNRMEAKLGEYADMGYDLESAREFRVKIKELKHKAESITYSLHEEED